MQRMRKNWVIFCLLVSGVSGCVRVFPEKQGAVDVILLETTLESQPNATPLPYQLLISVPVADPEVDNDRVAVDRNNLSLSYLKDVRWAGDLPYVVQAALLQMLVDTNGFMAVGGAQSMGNPDYALETLIQNFEIETKGGTALQAHVDLVFKLVDIRKRRVIEMKRFEKRAPIQTRSVDEVSRGFRMAFRQVGQDLTQWIYTRLAHS